MMHKTPLRDRATPVLTVGDVADLLAQTIPDDGEVPELGSMAYAEEAITWIEDLIQAEAAAYADDHGDDPPDPEAAFRAQRRLRSLHLALGLLRLVEERMQQ
ncbi:hypothetical protein K2Z83_20710 [Oscillochloris sp. ZM17-4]|uniref:hypothetical protein n=1 Tax=Oscillochloris sp. ZM17-4 TaxID=2866714 RepID=UPI001C73756B|nr:hypothetical protein [Oscillochloris sp. ZM17-4]MBX0330093.1 hypothetical protein [Oscillochloris sp. ZM17-4]